MTSFIVQQHKLELLPKKVQRMIGGLSELELSRLHAAFCNHDHFDILRLPLELRQIIYRLAFSTEKNAIRVQEQAIPVETHRACNMALTPSLSLLIANKQISGEAMEVFKASKQCMIATRFLLNLSPHQKNTLQFFRNFIFLVPVSRLQKYWEPRIFVGQILQQLPKQFVASLPASLKGTRFTLNIKFTNDGYLELDYLQPQVASKDYTEQKYFNLWSKVGMQYFVNKFQIRLRKELPNVTVSSNADDPWHEMLVEWLSSSEMRFVDHQRKRFGSIKRPGNPLMVTNLDYSHCHLHKGLEVKPDFGVIN